MRSATNARSALACPAFFLGANSLGLDADALGFRRLALLFGDIHQRLLLLLSLHARLLLALPARDAALTFGLNALQAGIHVFLEEGQQLV